MAAYHVMLVHFPIALWTTAALAILVRALSDGPFARAVDRALLPLLVLSLVFGAAAYAIGLLVWPLEAATSSPLARNHILAATWSLAYWGLVAVVRWRGGEAVWEGPVRWIMLGLAGLGAVLLSVTGTLGGHLVGTSTAVSQVLRYLGWEVYTTYYVPDLTLVAIVLAAFLLGAIGFSGYRTRPA
jgi:uncharacterized membrane protein